MRIVTGCLVALVMLSSTIGHASDSVDLAKTKTGILPNGGFYSLYEADCRDQQNAEVVSLKGKRRWCTLQDGTMSCFSSQQDAALNACSSSALAAAAGPDPQTRVGF